jgi:enoyl-CoA hydratase/carnithine racemase
LISLDHAIEALEALDAELPAVDGAVRLQRDGGVEVMTIDAASARNALSVAMMAQLGRHVRALRGSDALGLLIRSVGPSFCAGGNLRQVRAGLHDPERGARMSRAMTVILDGLLALPMPSVAAIGGPAVGGGVELATAADARIAHPSARFDPAQVRLGVAAGWGGAGRLSQIIGRTKALRFWLDGRPFDAERALELGLVDEIASDPEAVAAVWLERWAAWGAPARAFKAQVVAPHLASDAFATVWGGPTHRRAIGLDPLE